MRFVVTALVAVLAMAVTAPAGAQAPDDDAVPEGYKFCGWRMLGEKDWTTEPTGSGAWERVFAKRMKCRYARRAVDRVEFDNQSRPVLTGYRCKMVALESHFTDVRCRKRKSKATFRWQSGS